MKLKEIKGVFVSPKKIYYLGKITYGTPYFWPINFNRYIISIRKLTLRSEKDYKEYIKQYPHLRGSDKAKFTNLPMARRSKDWVVKIFKNYYWIEIGYPIIVKKLELGWKDKHEIPRFEWTPSFQIYFFKWQFCIWWNAPDDNNDLYYEMILWWKNYSDKDIVKAKESWCWQNMKGTSTWNDNYLIKKD